MPIQVGQAPGAMGPMPGELPPMGQMPAGMPKLTPEQQKQMQEGMQKAMDLMKNMSAEEKEKLNKMSMQEKIEFFKEKLGGLQQK